MYRVTLFNLAKEAVFETVCFRYPDDATLAHIMCQVDGDVFADICRLRDVECESVDFDFDQHVGAEIGRWK